jgi:hypothetical protein
MGISSLWSRLSRNPSAALARTRQKLDRLARGKEASFQVGDAAWTCYQRAVALAVKCGRDACQCRDKTPALLPVLPTAPWAGTR